MNSEQLNKWITLVANIGVLVGIVFLAVEVRQSNRIAIAATEMSVRDKFVSINESVLSNDEVALLLVKAADLNSKFSEVEVERLYAYLYVFINTWVAIDIAYTNGMVPRETFDIIQEDIRQMLRSYPALRPIMRETIDDYPAVTDTHVYKAMRQAVEEVGD